MTKDRDDAMVVRERSSGGGHRVVVVGEYWRDGVLVIWAEWEPARPARTQHQAWQGYLRALDRLLHRARERFGEPARIVEYERPGAHVRGRA